MENYIRAEWDGFVFETLSTSGWQSRVQGWRERLAPRGLVSGQKVTVYKFRNCRPVERRSIIVGA